VELASAGAAVPESARVAAALSNLKPRKTSRVWLNGSRELWRARSMQLDYTRRVQSIEIVESSVVFKDCPPANFLEGRPRTSRNKCDRRLCPSQPGSLRGLTPGLARVPWGSPGRATGTVTAVWDITERQSGTCYL
jgi:hypothetical protein